MDVQLSTSLTDGKPLRHFKVNENTSRNQLSKRSMFELLVIIYKLSAQKKSIKVKDKVVDLAYAVKEQYFGRDTDSRDTDNSEG